MAKPETQDGWARDLCAEVFRQHKVALSEDDPVVLLATVFERVLDQWTAERSRLLEKEGALLRSVATHAAEQAREAVAAEFGAQVKRLRVELLEDAESASGQARQAVNAALAIPGKHSQWKYRMEGVFVGGGLVIVGALLMHWLGH